MPIRRIITGESRDSKGVVVSDEQLSDAVRTSIWAADLPIDLPSDGSAPPFTGPLLPKPGGLHVMVLTLPAGFKKDPPALHRTPSVDCMLQLTGTSVFVLEGSEVAIAPGDWLISNGVVHDWRNDGEEPSVIVGIIYGAREPEGG